MFCLPGPNAWTLFCGDTVQDGLCGSRAVFGKPARPGSEAEPGRDRGGCQRDFVKLKAAQGAEGPGLAVV